MISIFPIERIKQDVSHGVFPEEKHFLILLAVHFATAFNKTGGGATH